VLVQHGSQSCHCGWLPCAKTGRALHTEGLGTLVGFDGRVKSCRLGDKLWQHVLAQRHNFCPSARYCSEHVYCVAFSDQLKYVDCCDLLTAAVCETEDIMADMLQIKSR
jgi:hypothetical protein